MRHETVDDGYLVCLDGTWDQLLAIFAVVVRANIRLFTTLNIYTYPTTVVLSLM